VKHTGYHSLSQFPIGYTSASDVTGSLALVSPPHNAIPQLRTRSPTRPENQHPSPTAHNSLKVVKMLHNLLSKLAEASSSCHSSSSSASYSFSSSFYYSDGTHTTSTGWRHATVRKTDASGRTTVRTANQNLGEPVVTETRQYDPQGREILGHDLSVRAPARGEIVDVTEYDSEEEREKERERKRWSDKKYWKRMEDGCAERGSSA
jgi:hypothetical protein